MRESNRSKMPPCPARILLVSLTFASRFNNDSAQSPNCPNIPVINPKATTSTSENISGKYPDWLSINKKIILLINPAIVPTQVLFGLISGNIFFFPNFFPNRNAPVSQIQTERNNARVILNPISDKFRYSDNEPSINPSHTNEKTNIEILSRGVSFFRNISTIIAVKAMPINNM